MGPTQEIYVDYSRKFRNQHSVGMRYGVNIRLTINLIPVQ